MGFAGKVKVGVICTTVKIDVTFLENTAKGKEMNNKETGPQNRALGLTSGDGKDSELKD